MAHTPKALDIALAATLAELAKIPTTAVEAKSAVSLMQFLTALSDPTWSPCPAKTTVSMMNLVKLTPVSPVVKTIVQRRTRGQENLVVAQTADSVVVVQRQQRAQPTGLAELTTEPVVAVDQRGTSEPRAQPTQAAVETETQHAKLFCQSVAPGVAQRVCVFHEDLPEYATLVVADEGIQFVSNANSQAEQQVLLAVRWPEVAFWAPRNQPLIAGVPNMDVLLLGIAGIDVLRDQTRPAGAKCIRQAQSVIKMEVTNLSVLRSALEQHRPLASPPAVGSVARRTMCYPLLANGPSCLCYPLPSVWQPEPPEEAALRACSSGLQLTTADEELQVLSAWRWEDVTFWRVSPGAVSDALDVLVWVCATWLAARPETP